MLTAYVGPHRDFYQLSEIPKKNNERKNTSFFEISNLLHIENNLRYYNCPVIFFMSFFGDNLDNFLIQFSNMLLILNSEFLSESVSSSYISYSRKAELILIERC